MSRAICYIAASALLFGLIQAHANLFARPTLTAANVSTQAAITVMRERATHRFFEPRIVQNTEVEISNSATAEPDHTQSSASTNAFDSVCQTLQSAAQLNDLPLGFLTRLIWQESRFNAHAISPAGARGIAQFMPGTAAWIGLANPFDVADAITKSAELLRSLKSQFGNLGLAAAAYNAGPKRVADWLAGRRGLPRETQAYVLIVTGHAAPEWTTPADRMSLNLPDGVPCPQIVKLFANDRLETPRTAVGRDNPNRERFCYGRGTLGRSTHRWQFANIGSCFVSSASAQVSDCPRIPPAARDSFTGRQKRLLVPLAHRRANSCRSRAIMRNPARSGRELSRPEELRNGRPDITTKLRSSGYGSASGAGRRKTVARKCRRAWCRKSR